MRTTGVIRRIDDLGRIVIPRAIRKLMEIEEGQPFEIYVEPTTGAITLIPYKPE